MEFSNIPAKKYYTNYQSALVLCGIGAAFRTATHLSTETAVVLQTCPFDEWFTHLMKPWEHYIPVDQELSDLEKNLQWMHDHPKEVQKIAKQGRQFHDEYVSFERNEDHVYELLYRLAAQTNNRTNA